jgi:hypothetical protein
MALTGKTIGELTRLDYTTNYLLLPIEESGSTYNIPFSAINYTEIVYSGLTMLLNVGELVAGQYYLITDFKTCYDQPDFNYEGAPITTGNYKQGSVSPILVLATGKGTISQLAYQPQYSGDTIYYDPYFSVTEVTGGEAFGRITYRIDNQGNAFDYDFREVLFKRYNTYSANGVYNGRVSIDGFGNVTGVDTFFQSTTSPGNIIGIVNPDSSYGVDFYEVVSIASETSMIVTGNTINNINNTLYTPSTNESGMSYKQNNIIGNTGFTEYSTFVNYGECFNNTCGNKVGTTIEDGYTFLLSNNVFRSGPYIDNSFGSYFRNNTFNDDCTGNTIKYRFYNNVIDNDFDNNIITSRFHNNMIVVDFNDNYVQNNFYNNNLGDDDGTSFTDNIINGNFTGNFYTGFNPFQYNTINGSFVANKILDSFEYNNVQSFNNNIIEDNFSNNQIGEGFNENVIKQQFSKNVLGDSVYQNDFYGSFTTNTGGPVFYNNTFYNNISLNNLGSDFYNNNIGDVANIGGFSFDHNSFQGGCNNNTFTGNTQFNKVGHEFYYNTIATNFSYNQIGDYFTSNTIANDFGFGGGNYRGNVIGNGFQSNNIGEYFYDNTIGDYFAFNQVQDYFVNNKVSYGFYGSTFADLDTSGQCQNNNFAFTNISLNLTFSGGVGGNQILYTNVPTNVVIDAADNNVYVTFLSGGTFTVQPIIVV